MVALSSAKKAISLGHGSHGPRKTLFEHLESLGPTALWPKCKPSLSRQHYLSKKWRWWAVGMKHEGQMKRLVNASSVMQMIKDTATRPQQIKLKKLGNLELHKLV